MLARYQDREVSVHAQKVGWLVCRRGMHVRIWAIISGGRGISGRFEED